MNNGYVWAILESHSAPVLGRLLHEEKSGGYIYYPASHKDAVLTIDVMLWRHARKQIDVSAVTISYWPDLNKISEIIDKGTSLDAWVLLAISELSTAMTIDPDAIMPLQSTPQLPNYFLEAGYDVVDASGLSALTNIGYTGQDILQLQSLNMKTTIFGLIEDRTVAQKFAELASEFAPEHAPFFSVKIFTNKLR